MDKAAFWKNYHYSPRLQSCYLALDTDFFERINPTMQKAIPHTGMDLLSYVDAENGRSKL